MLFDTTDLPDDPAARARVVGVRAAVVHLDHGPVRIAGDGLGVLVAAPDERGPRRLLVAALEHRGWHVTAPVDGDLLVHPPPRGRT